MVNKGYKEQKTGKSEVKNAILSQLPEILMTLFNVPEEKGSTLMTGTEVKHHDRSNVSMESDQASVSGILGTYIYKTGEKYLKNAENAILGPTLNKRQQAFMEILQPLSYIMDPVREESISSICMSKEGAQIFYKIPCQIILTTSSAKLINNHHFDRLSDLFHNLSAESSQQKAAFQNGQIMVNSWELLCMVLMKHLSSLPSKQSFYDIGKAPQRNDDSRLSLIMLVKIIEYIQQRKKMKTSPFETNRAQLQAETLVLATQEYMMIAISQGEESSMRRRFEFNGQQTFSVSTNSLEVIYVLISNLQVKKQLFTEKMNLNLKVEENLLLGQKFFLYQFFENAFGYTYGKDVAFGGNRQNRLSDVVMLWLKLLRPWNDLSEFLESAVMVDNPHERTHQTFDAQTGKPNTNLHSILANGSLSSLEPPISAFQLSHIADQRRQFKQYIDNMLPFYFHQLISYLEHLYSQPVYSFEDIQVFGQVMQLFQMQQEPLDANEDLTQPPKPHDQTLYVLDGFVDLRTFQNLVNQQRSSLYENSLRELSPDQAHLNQSNMAFCSSAFWDLIRAILDKMCSPRNQSFPLAQEDEYFNRSKKIIDITCEDIGNLGDKLEIVEAQPDIGTRSYRRERAEDLRAHGRNREEAKEVQRKLNFDQRTELSDISDQNISKKTNLRSRTQNLRKGSPVINRRQQYTSPPSKERRIMQPPQYEGNRWERPIVNSELTILYYFWLIISYGVDYISEIWKLKIHDQCDIKDMPKRFSEYYKTSPKYPESQSLRKMAKIQNNIFFVLLAILFKLLSLKSIVVLSGIGCAALATNQYYYKDR